MRNCFFYNKFLASNLSRDRVEIERTLLKHKKPPKNTLKKPDNFLLVELNFFPVIFRTSQNKFKNFQKIQKLQKFKHEFSYPKNTKFNEF